MKQSNLSVWLKTVLGVVGIWGILLYAWILPQLISHLLITRVDNPLPFAVYLIFSCATAIPLVAVFFLAWGIAARIGQGKSFSRENAVSMARMAQLMLWDAAYFFFGNALLLAFGKSAPLILLLALLVCVIVVSIAVAFAALSHLIEKAATMAVENELTI